MTGKFAPGDRVEVLAHDADMYGFIKGWRLRVSGYNCGHVEAKCPSPEFIGVELTFYLPENELQHAPA